ncbi:hypothetical protein DFQ30_008963, partial [Apophysomyces sp. BC1015]
MSIINNFESNGVNTSVADNHPGLGDVHASHVPMNFPSSSLSSDHASYERYVDEAAHNVQLEAKKRMVMYMLLVANNRPEEEK